MTIKELQNILANCSNDAEIKLYVKDLPSKIQFWYFHVEDIQIKEDGVYIELI